MIIVILVSLGAMPILAQETEEEEAPEPAWVGSLGLSWVATSGNTDTSSAGLDFGLNRKPEPWGVEFLARGNKAEDSGLTTAENYLVAARAVAQTERHAGTPSEGWSGARTPLPVLTRRPSLPSVRPTLAVESERHLLKFDGGFAYTWEDQVDPEQQVDFAGGILGLLWEWKLGANSKLVERLVFLPNFDNSSDWRLTSLTTIEAAVNSWLALRFGYDIRHRNQPIGDADSTDTTSTASVVFNF